MPTINIDMILSDPLLIVASVLLVVSPVVFLVAFVKFLRAPKPEKSANAFVIPGDELSSPVNSLALEPAAEGAPTPAAPELAPAPEEVFRPVTPDIPAPPPPPPPAIPDAEKTVVMAAGVAEMQGQLEIALTQIRTLNKKINELESNNSKIQTLAEHVIALEKDMARLKAASNPPSGEKRPPMPL